MQSSFIASSASTKSRWSYETKIESNTTLRMKGVWFMDTLRIVGVSGSLECGAYVECRMFRNRADSGSRI